MTLKNTIFALTLISITIFSIAITIKKIIFSKRKDGNNIKNLNQNANNASNVNQAGRDLNVR